MNNMRNLIGGIIIILVLIVLGYNLLTIPDRRTTTEKVGDAVHELPQGTDKAARQMESRTPGEKMGDSVKDLGDNIKNDTSNP